MKEGGEGEEEGGKRSKRPCSLQSLCPCRFVTQARELGLPIAILNIGATRADKLATLKIEAKAGDVLPRITL